MTFVNHFSGREIGTSKSNGLGPYRVSLRRSPSAGAFGIVIIAVLIAIAGLGLFVAIQTVRDRRKFQPPMTTWYAGDALCGGTAENRTSRLAAVRGLDRHGDRSLGARRIGDLDAALHRLLVAASAT
jgi:hypothetical protein